ncbi:MAG: DUF3291 domain-containing protein [Pseudolabrys sp.]|jgi:hypothetical protein
MTDARHLAQFNIARIRYPLDDPRMAEFVDNVERVNGLADKIPGFVWRLQDASGHAMSMRVYDDPTILPNLTVWENVQALERFVWQTLHQRFYARREQWFAPVKSTLVLWWIPAGHRPDMAEGMARRDHLIAHGPSDYAFGWREIAGAKLWKTAHCGAPSEHAA